MIKKELMFTFVSDGTAHAFQPFKQVYDPNKKQKRHQLDVMRDEVAFRNSPRVFIIDNTGHVLTK